MKEALIFIGVFFALVAAPTIAGLVLPEGLPTLIGGMVSQVIIVVAYGLYTFRNRRTGKTH